ncbi:hypothetical protein FHS42_001928 [Streptomyces zagrosensis]|uniref:Uncharacterized protein n=1 Tax=Streptomyces zagrosensis TaxID=1042984 RepID=A0A7W9UXG3_9ACTN|nr:hypothetical protein [Streptomyces zagrosensis]
MNLSTFTSAEAADVRDMILDMHGAVHDGSNDPFHSRERFSWFYDRWSMKPSWSCVTSRPLRPVGHMTNA